MDILILFGNLTGGGVFAGNLKKHNNIKHDTDLNPFWNKKKLTFLGELRKCEYGIGIGK